MLMKWYGLQGNDIVIWSTRRCMGHLGILEGQRDIKSKMRGPNAQNNASRIARREILQQMKRRFQGARTGVRIDVVAAC